MKQQQKPVFDTPRTTFKYTHPDYELEHHTHTFLPSAAKNGHKEVLEVLKELGAEGAAEALGKLKASSPAGSNT